MEKPEEDPTLCQFVVLCHLAKSIPIYLVSPQLLVTKEHIISESSSTSSAGFSVSGDFDFFLFTDLGVGSGEAIWLRGVGSPASFAAGVLW